VTHAKIKNVMAMANTEPLRSSILGGVLGESAERGYGDEEEEEL
jgi:hypothetical protein